MVAMPTSTNDSSINIIDVVELVNIVLGLQNINEQSDINGDSFIDILDIIQLENIILDTSN